MKFFVKPACVGLLLCAAAAGAAPLSVTISPNSITNNFIGSILLSISNLSSSGVTMRVDRVLDVNSNGFIDGQEFVGASFYVADGQTPLIGGVRDSNVPGDDDGLTNQVVHCRVPYPGVNLTLDHIAGQYIYRVTDLGNGQTAIGLLRIAQQVLPQGVTGRVFTAAGAPLTNAPVVASQTIANNGFGTISDANGNYTIYATPGAYDVFTVYSGQVANAAAGLVTIASNVVTTVNLTNVATDGTTISGEVIDSSTSAFLPGLLLQGQTSSGLTIFGSTGTNGNYSLKGTAANWTVKLGGGEGAILGYCRGPVTKIAANAGGGSVANVNFQLIKGNALAYGTVTAPPAIPLPEVQIDAADVNNQIFDSRGLSDSNGYYTVRMVAGSDSADVDSANLTGYTSSGGGSGTVTNGQAIEMNFSLQPVSAYLAGFVRDNNGNPIANIGVIIDPTNDTSGSLSLNTQTAPDGSFSQGVSAGGYNVQLECNSANSAGIVGPSVLASVANGVSQSNLVLAAYHSTAVIHGVVTNTTGNPIAFADLFASTVVGTTNYSSGCANTDSNGNYSLLAFAGNWTVGVDNVGSGYQLPPNQNATVTGTNNALVNFVVRSQNPAPILSQPGFAGNHFQFQLTGSPNLNYRIDASTNLLPGSWQPIYTNPGSLQFSDPATNYSHRFYRVVQVP